MMSLFARKPIADLLTEEGPRPFRVRFVWPVTILGAGACIYTMFGLPARAWERFGIWLAIGLILYFVYGFRKSTLRAGTPPVPIDTPGKQ